jgi:hypothetical protein
MVLDKKYMFIGIFKKGRYNKGGKPSTVKTPCPGKKNTLPFPCLCFNSEQACL